ncbi:MAG TPA: hypothetical protein VJ770_30615 [Stellaceae bacterium]|nr:hypothetical protein [Stellaceae bacterium]
MFDLPQLVFLILVIGIVWYGLRRLNGPPRDLPRRPGARPGMRPNRRQEPPPRIEAEDLVACRVCGTYVAAGAPDCGRRDCPRLRSR